MSPRPPLATVSLLLLFISCFVSRSLQSTDDQTAGPPFARSVTTRSSAGLQQAAQPDKTKNIVIPAQDSDVHISYDKPADVQSAESQAVLPQVAQPDKTKNVIIPPQESDAYPSYDKNASVQPDERQFEPGQGAGQISRSASSVMGLALLIALAPAFFIPLAASRGALSRGHWSTFSFALLPLLVFIPLLDTSMTAAIAFSFMMSGGNLPTSIAFIVGGYFILVGCALGFFIGAVICPAKKTE